jgi:hypothetical protein
MARVVTVWPDLSYAVWRDTAATLQLWTQIVGKVRLRLTPWVNHGWQVPLYVSARGLAHHRSRLAMKSLRSSSISSAIGLSPAPAWARSGWFRSNRNRLPSSIAGLSIF